MFQSEFDCEDGEQGEEHAGYGQGEAGAADHSAAGGAKDTGKGGQGRFCEFQFFCHYTKCERKQIEDCSLA